MRTRLSSRALVLAASALLLSFLSTGPALALCGNDLIDAPEEECDGIDDSQCPGGCLSDCTCGVCGVDPGGAAPRPLFSELNARLAPNLLGTTDPKVPDYVDVSKNLTIIQSIQLLISMATRAASQLNNLKSQVDSQQALGECECGGAQGTVSDTTRKDCEETTCFSDYPTNTVPADPVVWRPTDLYKGPAGDSRFALRLARFLDNVQTWTGDQPCLGDTTPADGNKDGKCTGGPGRGNDCDAAVGGKSSDCPSTLGTAIHDLNQIGINLTEFQKQLEEVLAWVDKLTEGFHLGAYSEQRPDLHLCIGYGGHNVFSALGGLAGDQISIGSRYLSYNISAKHRAQFRAGGFQAMAFGKALIILPGVEANIQMDGFALWDNEYPFGLRLPTTTVSLCDVTKYDLFHLIDEITFRQLACPGDASGPCANCSLVIPGGLLVKDLFTTPYHSDDDGNNHVWPRTAADNPGYTDVTYGREKRSTAVFSLGLNLAEHIDPIYKELTPIPFGYFTVIPHYSLEAGVDWYDAANKRRGVLQDMINKNIPLADQLEAADFERPMHAMQADDVTEDVGTTAFAKPGFGATLSADISPVRFLNFGLDFAATLKVLLQPGAFGGVSDLNWALNDTLLHSNVPPDQPCDPITQISNVDQCSNKNYPASIGEYCCGDCSTVECSGDILGGDGSKDGKCASGPAKDADCDADLPGNTSSDCPDTSFCDGALLSDGSAYIPCDGDADCEARKDDCPGQNCGGCTIDNQLTPHCTEYGFCILQDGVDGIPGNADDGKKLQDWVKADCESGAGFCNEYSGNAGAPCVDDSECTASNTKYCEGGTNDGSPCTSAADCPGGGDCVTVNEAACLEPSGTRLFAPYSCLANQSIEIVGAEGPGCNPLMWGYPAAGGSCSNPAECDPTQICIQGACLTSCSDDSACDPDTEVCDLDQGACVNKFGVPFAEQIAWGVQNVQAPMHAVTTYGWSEFTWGVYLPISIRLGMDVSAFGFHKSFDVFKYDHVFDLAHDSDGWYQGGLEAEYQDQCTAATPVTNRQPGPGFVKRYPVGVQQSLPVTTGNAGDTDQLEQWCKAALPLDVEDPEEPTPSNVTSAVENVVNWGTDIGQELWAATQLCIDGQPLYQWANATLDTVDHDFSSMQCTYDDGVTHYSFPCAKVTEALMLVGGCLSRDLNNHAQKLWDHFDGSNAFTIHDGTFNGHDVFDLDLMLSSAVEEPSFENLRPEIQDYGFFVKHGVLWYKAARECLGSFLDTVSPTAITVDVGTIGPCCGDGTLQTQGCGAGPAGSNVPPCEACDDGNVQSGDGCSPLCLSESNICGNSIVEEPEQCDEGAANFNWYGGDCCPDCKLPPCDRCGNGTLDSGEMCDDGNNRDNDGCSADCKPERSQDGGEQICTNGANKAAFVLAGFHGKLSRTCVAAAVQGRVADVEDCRTPPYTDARTAAAVAKANSRAGAAFAKTCGGTLPPYAVTNAPTITTAAENEAIALLGDIFGLPLPVFTAGDAGTCQSLVVGSVEKLAAAKRKLFVQCKKRLLRKGTILSASTLANQCFGQIIADQKGHLGRLIVALEAALAKCGAVALTTAFPGCSGETASFADLALCMDRHVECRVCRFFRAVDALPMDCDLFDDGLDNGTCP